MEITIAHEPGFKPNRATEGSSGFDLKAFLPNGVAGIVMVAPQSSQVIPTGIRLAMPLGIEAQVRPRSGLAARNSVVAALGTIDSDYRGDIGVILINHGTEPFFVRRGDRIAQLVFAKVEIPDLVLGDVTVDTDRGNGGFGSTGK